MTTQHFLRCGLLAAALAALSIPSLSEAAADATVSGTLVDPGGAVYVCKQCTVTLTSAGFTQTTTVGPEGRFHFRVPAGTYNISAREPFSYPLVRARFRLGPGESAEFLLAPRLRVLATVTEVTANGFKDTDQTAPAPKFEEVITRRSEEPLGIEYLSKQAKPGVTVYHHAVLSHHTLTVYAAEITYSDRTSTVHARGETIILDEGGTRRRIPRRLTIRLQRHARCISD